MIFIYSVGLPQLRGQPRGDHDRPGLPPHGAAVRLSRAQAHRPLDRADVLPLLCLYRLFAFGMYTLVVSDNLLTLFVGWEIMGLCSYLLIGFWYGKPRRGCHDQSLSSPPASAICSCCWASLTCTRPPAR
jgi:NADH-quinone oxidoreductase subunit L